MLLTRIKLQGSSDEALFLATVSLQMQHWYSGIILVAPNVELTRPTIRPQVVTPNPFSASAHLSCRRDASHESAGA